MDSGPRNYKIGRKVEDPQITDRISGLPDEVLGQILSFLPTKYAVATSSLSSRWRNLHKLCTSLDFDDSDSFKFRKGLSSVRRRNTRFREFVDMVMARCKESHISNFKLKCRGDSFDHSVIRHWIEAAFFHNISKLEISIHTRVFHCLPLQLSLSTCHNLVVLKLDGSLVLCVPNSVTFPCLKMLFFKEIKFSVGTCLNSILSQCPLLEELGIEGCVWEGGGGGGHLYITNPLLKRLTLDDDGMTGDFDQFVRSLVYFDAPSLIYLKYCESLAEQYMVRNLKALVEAHIEICFNDDEFEEAQDLCDAILDLVIGVSNCELLYLSGQCLEALTSGEYKLPILQNLTRLELGLGCDVSWNDILLDFLNCTPCLKDLTFVEGLVKWNAKDDELDEDVMLDDQAVPSCVTCCLKAINIERFRGFKEELGIIKYFLENAIVLDELVVHWCQQNIAKDIHIKEEDISKLQKASKTCSISFR